MNDWKKIAQDVKTGSDAEIAEFLERAYRLGVTNATGILRRHVISAHEEFSDGSNWLRTFPQDTADDIERLLLEMEPESTETNENKPRHN